MTRIGKDVRLIITTRALRTFGYGCTSVLLAGMLDDDGVAPSRIGMVLASAAAGCVIASVLMGLFADRFGRRASLLVSACLMGCAGVVFAVCESYPWLVIAAFVGTISPSTNDNTPFSGVEQAILAQATPEERHATVFTRYNVAAQAAGALGGLAAAVLGVFPMSLAGDAAFALYSMIAFATAGCFLRLSPAIEAPIGETEPADSVMRAVSNPASHSTRQSVLRLTGIRPLAHRSTHRPRLPASVRRLAGLFAVDAFAGGLAVQAILAWWLHHRFNASLSDLGLLFFAANLLPALAQLAAPRLVKRHGLLPAILVPHLASNLLLACIPLAPDFTTAVVLLLARQTLSKIDVPARQAFTAALVGPEHRTAAASLTTVARSVAVSASPMAATALLAEPLAALGAPLLLGAALAIGYDVAMWRTFRSAPAAPG
jgi:MFS family permease